MEKKNHLLSDVWNEYPEVIPTEENTLQAPEIGQFLNDILCIGPYYYYVINIANYELSNFHPRVLEIHGFERYPTQLMEIIELIHPEDLSFVKLAEKMIIEKLHLELHGSFMNWKSSYCFRMRLSNGSYHLFHHQAIHLAQDDSTRLTYSLNIHTDIEHLSSSNSGLVLLQTLSVNPEQIFLDPLQESKVSSKPKLSRREMEILPYIANGLSSRLIASKLFISENTVRSHRKNILRKTKSNSSNVLIKRCLEWGYL